MTTLRSHHNRTTKKAPVATKKPPTRKAAPAPGTRLLHELLALPTPAALPWPKPAPRKPLAPPPNWVEPAGGTPLTPPVRTAANVEHGRAGLAQRPKGPAGAVHTPPNKPKAKPAATHHASAKRPAAHRATKRP